VPRTPIGGRRSDDSSTARLTWDIHPLITRRDPVDDADGEVIGWTAFCQKTFSQKLGVWAEPQSFHYPPFSRPPHP